MQQTLMVIVQKLKYFFFSQGDSTTGSLPGQDALYNPNILIVHFLTSHSLNVSQPTNI